jgi:hypothetical protein
MLYDFYGILFSNFQLAITVMAMQWRSEEAIWVWGGEVHH